DDVRLVSPITAQFTFQGRARVRVLFEEAFAVLQGITYTDQLLQERTAVLCATARIGGVRAQEVQLLRLDDAGLIREITLFVRPLPALTGLAAALGPRLARREGRPALSLVFGAAAAGLHAMAGTGEQRLLPHVAPR
ncbi:nuclear transport factor 2 family protein, partial [Kineococcus glutinatus]|uniref:nuclear transport factor 2 family protein n=1 Tax=Kineococcus glutinatus TaxID=1070872 RepID=UPI0031E5AD13